LLFLLLLQRVVSDAEGTTKVAIPEEAQDDLEAAWENLDAARVIYKQNLNDVSSSSSSSSV